MNPRIGYGAMRLPGMRGVPRDDHKAHEILTRAVDLGVTVFDTADFYGPQLANALIAEALYSHYGQVLVSTKVGVKGTDKGPVGAATREDILESVDRNLTSLRMDSLDLVFLRLPGGPLGDTGVPMEESLTVLASLQAEGIIKHIGLSSASLAQIETARTTAEIHAIQNAYWVGNMGSQVVLEYCTVNDIAFMPYFPLAAGRLATESRLAEIANVHSASASQIALAWLLAKSPVMVPIPGTSQIQHLVENVAAASIGLAADQIRALDSLH